MLRTLIWYFPTGVMMQDEEKVQKYGYDRVNVNRARMPEDGYPTGYRDIATI